MKKYGLVYIASRKEGTNEEVSCLEPFLHDLPSFM
jgi:hypothetical protein